MTVTGTGTSRTSIPARGGASTESGTPVAVHSCTSCSGRSAMVSIVGHLVRYRLLKKCSHPDPVIIHLTLGIPIFDCHRRDVYNNNNNNMYNMYMHMYMYMYMYMCTCNMHMSVPHTANKCDLFHRSAKQPVRLLRSTHMLITPQPLARLFERAHARKAV